LIAKGMAGFSVSRVISSIREEMNFAISEYALDLKNPFVVMYYDRLAGVSKRLPIPIEHICATYKALSLMHIYKYLTDMGPWNMNIS
jgi:hypothetical protein